MPTLIIISHSAFNKSKRLVSHARTQAYTCKFKLIKYFSFR